MGNLVVTGVEKGFRSRLGAYEDELRAMLREGLSTRQILFAGYPPIVVPTESRAEYIRALWDYQCAVA